jgi:hypothetical protein
MYGIRDFAYSAAPPVVPRSCCARAVRRIARAGCGGRLDLGRSARRTRTSQVGLIDLSAGGAAVRRGARHRLQRRDLQHRELRPAGRRAERSRRIRIPRCFLPLYDEMGEMLRDRLRACSRSCCGTARNGGCFWRVRRIKRLTARTTRHAPRSVAVKTLSAESCRQAIRPCCRRWFLSARHGAGSRSRCIAPSARCP